MKSLFHNISCDAGFRMKLTITKQESSGLIKFDDAAIAVQTSLISYVSAFTAPQLQAIHFTVNVSLHRYLQDDQLNIIENIHSRPIYINSQHGTDGEGSNNFTGREESKADVTRSVNCADRLLANDHHRRKPGRVCSGSQLSRIQNYLECSQYYSIPSTTSTNLSRNYHWRHQARTMNGNANCLIVQTFRNSVHCWNPSFQKYQPMG